MTVAVSSTGLPTVVTDGEAVTFVADGTAAAGEAEATTAASASAAVLPHMRRVSTRPTSQLLARFLFVSPC
ncbi:hypothetical protein STXM2123_5996 [Streptomyces sp. F-3]|nr:hypothetical protein STXM2123_5996 [Streptomyces sp. F-3]